MITIPPDAYIQVQDNTGRQKGHGRWHAALCGPGILCDVVRHSKAKSTRWRFGTDKVNCPDCLAVMQAPSVVRHSVYELVGA